MVISRVVKVPGIVIGASVMSSKATELHLECRNCEHVSVAGVSGGFSGVTLPRVCGRERVTNDPSPKCPLDPYFVVHEKSRFIDQQVIKLQEAPDQVPVGELPRHVLISADRYLTNRVVPGSRCTVMGVFSIYQNKASSKNATSGAVAIRTPYLRAVGIRTDLDQTAKGSAAFTAEEEQDFVELSRRPDLFNVMADCIAPSIYGNKNIKKAILCLLLGGSKKILPDGMKLRGDINVLLLGDPGTAKSQLLKFVSLAAPISIYTSGKGSSAAGLTASVQRDSSTREFYLEGGAMVLADGGVVCIDEFDKMRDEDRVAIHEAMEQQTISIAKAGITTILNARTSVLAAANPIFGRYDDMKTPGENIDFQTTILSRFDMIFIVRDEHTREKDERIAKHVIGIHMGGRGIEEQAEAEISVDRIKRYLAYCKRYVTIFLFCLFLSKGEREGEPGRESVNQVDLWKRRNKKLTFHTQSHGTSPQRRSGGKAIVALCLDPATSARRRARSQRTLLDPHYCASARSHYAYHRIYSQTDTFRHCDRSSRRAGHPALPCVHHGRCQPGCPLRWRP